MWVGDRFYYSPSLVRNIALSHDCGVLETSRDTITDQFAVAEYMADFDTAWVVLSKSEKAAVNTDISGDFRLWQWPVALKAYRKMARYLNGG